MRRIERDNVDQLGDELVRLLVSFNSSSEENAAQAKKELLDFVVDYFQSVCEKIRHLGFTTGKYLPNSQLMNEDFTSVVRASWVCLLKDKGKEVSGLSQKLTAFAKEISRLASAPGSEDSKHLDGACSAINLLCGVIACDVSIDQLEFNNLLNHDEELAPIINAFRGRFPGLPEGAYYCLVYLHNSEINSSRTTSKEAVGHVVGLLQSTHDELSDAEAFAEFLRNLCFVVVEYGNDSELDKCFEAALHGPEIVNAIRVFRHEESLIDVAENYLIKQVVKKTKEGVTCSAAIEFAKFSFLMVKKQIEWRLLRLNVDAETFNRLNEYAEKKVTQEASVKNAVSEVVNAFKAQEKALNNALEKLLITESNEVARFRKKVVDYQARGTQSENCVQFVVEDVIKGVVSNRLNEVLFLFEDLNTQTEAFEMFNKVYALFTDDNVVKLITSISVPDSGWSSQALFRLFLKCSEQSPMPPLMRKLIDALYEKQKGKLEGQLAPAVDQLDVAGKLQTEFNAMIDVLRSALALENLEDNDDSNVPTEIVNKLSDLPYVQSDMHAAFGEVRAQFLVLNDEKIKEAIYLYDVRNQIYEVYQYYLQLQSDSKQKGDLSYRQSIAALRLADELCKAIEGSCSPESRPQFLSEAKVSIARADKILSLDPNWSNILLNILSVIGVIATGIVPGVCFWAYHYSQTNRFWLFPSEGAKRLDKVTQVLAA